MNSIPFYLMALIVAIAKTPLDIYQICAWNHGTEKTEPWRSKRPAAIGTRLRALTVRLCNWGRAAGGLPLITAVATACIVALLLTAPQLHAMTAPHTPVLTAIALGVPGLKGYRQRDNDLKAEKAKVTKERAAIGETAMRENRAMTKDEKDKFLALGPTIEGLQAQIDENAELLVAAEASNEAERTFKIVKPDPDVQADAAAQAAAGLQPHTPSIVVVDMTKKVGYFGRQLQAVRNAALALKDGQGLSASDRDLLKPMQAAATGMTTDVPSDGGFLVAPERSSTIIQRMYSTGEVMSRVFNLPIGPNSNGILLPAIDETSRADNSRYGGIVSGWLGQGNTLAAGKPKFRLMDLKLRKVAAFVYTTDELLADAVALDGWINKYLPMELTFRTEDSVFNGVGSNQPLGLLNSGAVISLTRATSGHITSDDLRAMVNRLWAPLWPSAVFFVDQSTLGEFDQLAIPIGTGGALDPSYKPAGSVPGQKYGTYKGIPIIPVEYCAALGTVGDIVLTSLSEYTTIDKGGVEQAVSLHVAFLTDEAVYRFIYRVDGQLSWNAALTPKNGGNSLSCAVVLAT